VPPVLSAGTDATGYVEGARLDEVEDRSPRLVLLLAASMPPRNRVLRS